jgi:hypothetical protein
MDADLHDEQLLPRMLETLMSEPELDASLAAGTSSTAASEPGTDNKLS